MSGTEKHDGLKADFQAKMAATRQALAGSGEPPARMLAELAPLVEAYQEWCNDVPTGTSRHDMLSAQANLLSNLIGFTICFHALNASLPADLVAVEVGRKVNAATHDYVRNWSAGYLDSYVTGKDGRDFDFRDFLGRDLMGKNKP